MKIRPAPRFDPLVPHPPRLSATVQAIGLAGWLLFILAAAALLWPYLAWVSFASALTLASWQLNPGVLA